MILYRKYYLDNSVIYRYYINSIMREVFCTKAAKGKTQVTLTLPVEMHDRLLDMANDADRTLAGYIRWMLNESLKKIDKENSQK